RIEQWFGGVRRKGVADRVLGAVGRPRLAGDQPQIKQWRIPQPLGKWLEKAGPTVDAELVSRPAGALDEDRRGEGSGVDVRNLVTSRTRSAQRTSPIRAGINAWRRQRPRSPRR